jgi:hypothetical protein
MEESRLEMQLTTFDQSVGGHISRQAKVSQRGRRLSRPGHESLTLAFCLATRRCMNLGPSFLASTP